MIAVSCASVNCDVFLFLNNRVIFFYEQYFCIYYLMKCNCLNFDIVKEFTCKCHCFFFG